MRVNLLLSIEEARAAVWSLERSIDFMDPLDSQVEREARAKIAAAVLAASASAELDSVSASE